MVWWLAYNAVTASALAVIVFGVCRAGRFRPALCHALWVLVLLKLLSPTWLEWPWTFTEPDEPVVAQIAEPVLSPIVVVTGNSAPVVNTPPDVTQPKGPANTDQAASPVRAPLPTLTPPSPPQAAVVPWHFPDWLGQVPLAVWGLGCLAMGLLQITRVARLFRRARFGEEGPDWLTNQVALQARALGIRPPHMVVVPGTGSPFLACFGQPLLVIPRQLLTQLPEEAWPSILVHEMAHLRRRDHLVVWIELVATCVWWWFPLFWFIRRQLRFHAELACDAWVVSTLPDQRREYAEALIDVSRLSGSAEPLPALALGGGARKLLERRLTMILCDRVPARVPVLALTLIGLLAVVILPGWLPGQKPQSEMLKPLPLEEALKKARVDGKYEMLLAQFKDEKGAETHGAFKDIGPQSVTEHGTQKNLPRGRWVYVYPYYYIWRDLSSAAKPNRNWGPEQATGEPNTTEAGDIVTAWASQNPDGRDEWLIMEYPEAVTPRAVMVHETFNPGALVRVTVFKLDGEEVEVWKGEDPTSPEDGKGVSVIPFKVDFKVNRVKIYIDSNKVAGWNEIDAVGLKDDKAKVQWASNAHASTTYAQQDVAAFPPPVNINALMMNEERIRKLEDEVKQLKMVIEDLKKKMDKDK